MLNPNRCIDCGTYLKTRKGIRCPRCWSKKRCVDLGIDWKQNEVSLLTKYADGCEEMAKIKTRLDTARSLAAEHRKIVTILEGEYNTVRETVVFTRNKLLVTHNRVSISHKLTSMIKLGQLAHVKRVHICLKGSK